MDFIALLCLIIATGGKIIVFCLNYSQIKLAPESSYGKVLSAEYNIDLHQFAQNQFFLDLALHASLISTIGLMGLNVINPIYLFWLGLRIYVTAINKPMIEKFNLLALLDIPILITVIALAIIWAGVQ